LLTIQLDSSVSQCSPSKTITPAAYLLFYRRHSDDTPLGPPTVKNWFHKYWDSGNESETSSRAESPANNQSGKGQRLGELTSKESSSASVVAGAGRHLRGGEVGSGATSNNLSKGKNLDDLYDDDADAEEDEGIGMEYEAPIGPDPPSYHVDPETTSYGIHSLTDSGWGWDRLPGLSSRDPRADVDNDSVEAFDGEDEDGGADLRTMEGFGDDLSAFQHHGGGIDSAHHTSPILRSTEYDEQDMEEMPMIGDHSIDTEEVMDVIGAEVDEDVEAPVAEVRIDDGDELAKKE
jgi:ubiquitin carboxyl-terminal hydrolase 4/11/15